MGPKRKQFESGVHDPDQPNQRSRPLHRPSRPRHPRPKELGVKLEKVRSPISLLVIDHVEEKPPRELSAPLDNRSKLYMPFIRTLATAVCASTLLLPALAQSAPSAAPAFEVADVHPSPRRLHAQIQGGIIHGDRYYLRNATMIDLIAATYKVDPNSIFGGPAWLAFDHFDILAKVPPAATNESTRVMLRTLLADRFKLMANPGMRPLPAFVLSAGKTPRLKPAATTEPGNCDYQQPPKDAPPATVVNIRFSCHNVTMADFVNFLHDVASPYLTRPAVDQTGLKGGWDFDIAWTYQIPKDTDGVTIFAAVDKQLGLKLEQKTAPIPVVLVASVNEVPTPNIAGLDKILPPSPPAQFDVAIIRPFNPTEKHFTIDVDPSGRVTIQHASLLTLIYSSYDINPNNITNQPKWLNSDLWDIVGKADSTAGPPIPGAAPVLDMDEAKEMIRSLLADRFKLVTHMETQPSEAYALVAAGPKMKKADPTNHPDCHEGPGPDGKDPRVDNPLLNRLVSCQNMTMPELADQLTRLAAGYVPAPVFNATGLDGAYDLTLSFSKKGDETKTIPASPSPSGENSASDPTLGGMSFYDAIQKQLGLKLEKREKIPLPVLVIDHVEQQPTDN
jgi:uncharacterized protein (TIGR03435 family)